MALPTFQAFYQSVKAGFASFGTTVTGFTFIGGGTSVAIMYNVGAGPVQSSTFYQNVNYVGVPGPELAAVFRFLPLPLPTVPTVRSATRAQQTTLLDDCRA